MKCTATIEIVLPFTGSVGYSGYSNPSEFTMWLADGDYYSIRSDWDLTPEHIDLIETQLQKIELEIPSGRFTSTEIVSLEKSDDAFFITVVAIWQGAINGLLYRGTSGVVEFSAEVHDVLDGIFLLPEEEFISASIYTLRKSKCEFVLGRNEFKEEAKTAAQILTGSEDLEWSNQEKEAWLKTWYARIRTLDEISRVEFNVYLITEKMHCAIENAEAVSDGNFPSEAAAYIDTNHVYWAIERVAFPDESFWPSDARYVLFLFDEFGCCTQHIFSYDEERDY